jgi:hypothetical protein
MERCAARLWAAAMCASVALLCGCGGGSADNAPPNAPFDGDPQQGLGAVGPITLNAPVGQGGLIRLDWSSSGDATVFSAWMSAADGKPFVEVAANVSGNSADFDPRPSWQLDFPTARVLVRGCDASGDACIDSNTQPLADALVASRRSLIPRVDPSSSTVGGSSRYAIDDAGTTIAALRSTQMGMFGELPENFSPARVDLYGLPGNPFSIDTPDYRAPSGIMALSGDGNTLAFTLTYSFGGQSSPAGVAGVVVVYYNERNTMTEDGRAWRLQAVLAAPPSMGPVESFGQGLQLSDDGRRLAATALDSVLVFDKQTDGTWKFEAQITGAATRHIAMSGNGRVIAFGALAGTTPAPHYEVRVHECACGGATWPLRATLRSDEFPYADAAALDDFGDAPLALSDDGNTLAVGAPRERSATRAGSVYVFGDSGGGQWQRQAHFVNAAEPGADLFGLNLSLSGDGRVLAASACGRFAPSSGVNRNYATSAPPVSNELCNPLTRQTGVSHGVHVFQRDAAGAWDKTASVVPVLPQPVLQTEPLQRNLMIPLLDRDGSTLGIGAYRDSDPFDTWAGEASLLIY